MPDDFLLVTSEDWAEVEGVADHILNNIGVATLQGLIADAAWGDILTAFNDVWAPAEGYSLVGAKVLTDTTPRFFVKTVAA